MIIHSITLKNIACFENEEIDFLNPETKKPVLWNVLLGENGTGKTTILRSIALLLQGSVIDVISLLPRPDEFVRYKKEQGVISGTIELRPNKIIERELVLSNNRTKTPFFKSGYSDLKYYPEFIGSLLVGLGSTRLPSFEPTRILAKPIFTGSKYAERVHGLFFDGIPLTNMDRWLDDEARRSRRNNEEVSRFHHIITLIEELLDIEFEAFLFNPDMQVSFKTDYGCVPLSGLAHGQKDILSIVIEILKAIADNSRIRNPAKAKGIVIIEEMAKHIHPVLQRKFIDTLKEVFPKLQFIVTTHSPLIAQTLNAYELVLLEKMGPRRKSYIKIERSAMTPKGLSVDQLLTSEYFGLDTATDTEVVVLRSELFHLKKKIIRGFSTRKDETRYRRLRKQLDNFSEGPGKSFQEYVIFKEITDRMKREGREDLLEFPSVHFLKERRSTEKERVKK